MSEPIGTAMQRDRRFDPSVSDFMQQAQRFGWPFWRGVIVGFVAVFPIAFVALS